MYETPAFFSHLTWGGGGGGEGVNYFLSMSKKMFSVQILVGWVSILESTLCSTALHRSHGLYSGHKN